jgi:transcription antitermination factor NusA-like protein
VLARLKIPLDRICVKSGVFCPSCQRKIETGVVTETDLKVLRELVNLEEKLKWLKKGEYVRSVETAEDLILLIKDGYEQNELLQLEKELESAFNKRVKIVEYVNDQKKIIEQIIAPASLLGVNKVWLPTGEEIITVRVSRRDRKFLKNREQYESIIGQLLGVKVKIAFE